MPEQIPEGSIVLTPAQMYGEMQRDIGAIRTDVQHITVSLSGVPAAIADHETRLRRLERALWIGVGAAAALGSAVGSAFSALIQ